jgi:hypothetical protein
LRSTCGDNTAGLRLAATQSLEDDPKAALEAHPLFDQGRDPSLLSLQSSVETIDVLISPLKGGQ